MMASKTSKKMDVLVYSGNGSTSGAARHAVYTLSRLLSPNYAVIQVTESVILKEPWTASCALLVFPGGADLGYCRSLNGEGNRRIAEYVRRGGLYLGLCAGGYYGSQRCEFEVGDKKMEVIGSRELAFFPGICRGCAFKGFVYNSEAGARVLELKVQQKLFISGAVPETFKSYYNGGGVFISASKLENQGVEVLARYVDQVDVEDDDGGAAAIVCCKVGDGRVLLTGPHPEFAGVNLDRHSGVPGYSGLVDSLLDGNDARVQFFGACLVKLGLIVSGAKTSVPPLSRIHLSSLFHDEVSQLLSDLKEIITVENGEKYIRGENDTFQIEPLSKVPIATYGRPEDQTNADGLDDASADDRILDYKTILKCLVPHEMQWPPRILTPYFDHSLFFTNLMNYQEKGPGEPELFGKIVMYGEVVTSTNTILEKNPKLLSRLPTGFTAIATTQVAARGRGSNVWIAPRGSMMFSTCIKHSIQLNSSAPIVFVQYLMAIAVAEGIQSYAPGYENFPIRLKWPNDIYAQDPKMSGQKPWVKVGGILVNSSYSAGDYSLVVGLGLNVANSAPTTSLNAILPPSRKPFGLETLLARILTTFEVIYDGFCRTGFDNNLEQKYYKHWLHTDQIVTLEQEGGARARIKGITRDWGLLRVEELAWEDRPTGKIWELQSDSNSFDFFKGLMKRKV